MRYPFLSKWPHAFLSAFLCVGTPSVSWGLLQNLDEQSPNLSGWIWIFVLGGLIVLIISWVLLQLTKRKLPDPKKALAVRAPIQTSDVPPSFQVFLSYNSEDLAEVLRLASALRKHGLRVWFDKWELRPGQPWLDAIEAQMKRIESAAVLVGASGFGPWHKREMRAFLMDFVESPKPVIPVLLPSAASEPELPLFLREFTWVDLSRRTISGLPHAPCGTT